MITLRTETRGDILAPASRVERTAVSCAESLARADLKRVADALDAIGVTWDQSVDLVRGVTELPATRDRLSALKHKLTRFDLPAEDSSFEQLLLIRTALAAMPRVSVLPLADRVKEQLYGEFEFLATPDARGRRMFRLGSRSFVGLCKMASLRRFPAGLFQWEVSALPRSWLLRVPPRSLPRVACFVVARLKGVAPVFFPHLNPRRSAARLLENDANQSYYLMAKSLELQPQIKGLVGASWFRSPDTQAASPHLAWLSRIFLENGGLVTTIGPASEDCGVFAKSRHRRDLYESGRFTPTTGLVIWPRNAMLEWAAAHPEYAQSTELH